MTKGDGGAKILPTNTNSDTGIACCSLKFLKGCSERLFKRRSPVRLEGFLRHEDGHQFGFGQLEQRQVGNRLGEAVPAPRVVELDRQVELVTHVVEVALDGLGSDLDRSS